MGIATDDIPQFERTASDPRLGLDRPVGWMVTDGTGATYLKVGTGTTDWAWVEGWKYQTLGAPATTISFTGLNGDLDVGYEFLINVKFNSSVALIDIRPNSLTTNQRAVSINSNNGAAPGASPVNTLTTVITRAATFNAFARGYFFARRGAGGRAYCSSSVAGQAAANVESEQWSGCWQEDATNVTQLDFTASAASGMGAGSMIALRPLGVVR